MEIFNVVHYKMSFTITLYSLKVNIISKNYTKVSLNYQNRQIKTNFPLVKGTYKAGLKFRKYHTIMKDKSCVFPYFTHKLNTLFNPILIRNSSVF